MSLNIKNPETHKLARELADLAGESMTEAVTVAVRERLSRVRRQHGSDYVERVMKIAEDIAKRLGPPIDHGEFLYDERGLPR